jgi:ketopantoate hydroxymethyltransferase
MITIHDLRAWKTDATRWTMLTAYDYPTAQILDAAGVPVILVGDSVGRNVLGYPNELPVTMEEMLHHTRAVTRGVERAMGGRHAPMSPRRPLTTRPQRRPMDQGGRRPRGHIEGPQYE